MRTKGTLIRMLALTGSLVCLGMKGAEAQQVFWTNEVSVLTAEQRLTDPKMTPRQYRQLALDESALRRSLTTPDPVLLRKGVPLTVDLPLPERGFARFTLTPSDVMPQELAARYPEIVSYRGTDAQGRRVRLDVSPQGIEAAVTGDRAGAWQVRPVRAATALRSGARPVRYWSFREADVPRSAESFHEPEIADTAAHAARSIPSPRALATGAVRYDYRIAVAATSRYAEKFGSSVPATLASIVRTINRVNDYFENDFGIHLTLVAGNDKLIYTNPKKDPYLGNVDPLEVNVANFNSIIGKDRYDVGHVFDGEGFNGVAGGLGVTCLPNKGKGYSSSSNPVESAFFPQLVAHELGHQFGAWHVFNGCYRPTLSDRAVEPGGGSTIMGYAGICEAVYNLQDDFDRQPYYNAANIAQVQGWIASVGGSCAAKRINSNAAPWIDPESLITFPDNFPSIPARTPFRLAVRATHGNPDARLTYTWEQMDIGPKQIGPLKDDGRGPLFRSFPPELTGVRYFPRLAALLGDEPLGNGELLPSTNRRLNFRVTVRDNFDTQATTASADLPINVVDTGRPFVVTAPNRTQMWKTGQQRRVTWDVAGTDREPIACKTVNVELSVDGGYTYLPTALAAGVPNSGSASVRLPALPRDTTQGRFRVSCVDNLFFAVSPVNVVISRR